MTAGTDPCSVDTDGYGLPDGEDPAPLVPGTGTEPLGETVPGPERDALRDEINDLIALVEAAL